MFNNNLTDQDLDQIELTPCVHSYKKTSNYTQSDGSHCEFFACKKCGKSRSVKRPQLTSTEKD